MLYYAKLNENQICTEIITRTELLPAGLSGYVKLPEYNQTFLWRKWEGDQWSQETHEPAVSFELLQQRIQDLEEENSSLQAVIADLRTQNEENYTALQLALAEIAELLAGGEA